MDRSINIIAIGLISVVFAIMVLYQFDNINLGMICSLKCADKMSSLQSNPYSMRDWIVSSGGNILLNSWLQGDVNCTCTMRMNGQKLPTGNFSNMTKEELINYWETEYYSKTLISGNLPEMNELNVIK